jgi:hypothetical protein
VTRLLPRAVLRSRSGPRRRASPPVLAFPLLRAGYGVTLLCAPGALLGLCTGRQASRRSSAVVRVLGVRHLSQAAVTAGAPTATVLSVGALVDVAHAVSMLALAVGDRPLRRAELIDALAAAILAAVGVAVAPAGGP